MALYFASIGYIHYIPRIMSCYRLNSIGSWSSMMDSDNSKKVTQHKNIIKGFKSIDEFTKQKYSSIIKKAINREEAKIMLLEDKYSSLLTSPRCFAALCRTMTHKTVRKLNDRIQAVHRK